MNKIKAAEALKSLENQLKGGPGSGPRPRGGSGSSASIQSNNTSYGFFGTMSHHLGGHEDAEDEAGARFSEAASQIVREYKVDPKVARNYLDSMFGRHIADRIHEGHSVSQAMQLHHGSPAKVQQALRKIREWTNDGDIFPE